MGYKDRIQTASFRNVSFFTATHSFAGGRRIVQHEFPERDEPFAEDMGRKAREYTVEGHIIAEDYFGARDRLVRALEKKSWGVLIHPYLGRMEVMVDSFSIAESITEGRIVQFSMTFKERGRTINPTGVFGSIFAFIDQVNETIDDIQAEFQSIYELTLLPGYVADSALGVFNNVTDTFTEALGIVPNTLSSIDQVKNDILDFGNSLPTIITDSVQLSTDLIVLQKSTSTITNDAKDKQKIQNEMITFGDDEPEPPILTDARVAEQANNQAAFRLVQGVAIAEICKWFVLSVTQPTDITDREQRELENNTVFSIGDLQERRDEIVGIIDEHIEKHGDFESVQSFVSLKGNMLNALPKDETTTELRREQTITPKETFPSLYLMYDQFESIESEQDFLDRNKIQNPAFVTGGVNYEVVEVI